MRILELFAGYGSQALALENLGIEFTSDIAEIDKYAIEAYTQLHGQVRNWGDVSRIDETKLPQYDLITYSFPCQDISLAGLQRGLDNGTGTRSSLLWECERIIRAVKPKYLLMENVKNLVSDKHKKNFIKWIKVLESLGYQNWWQVLNAKDYGVPQNRERVFVASILGGGQYLFLNPIKLTKRLKDVLESNVSESYYLPQQRIDKITQSAFHQEKHMIQNTDVCDTILARDYKDPKCIKEPMAYDEQNEYIRKDGTVGTIMTKGASAKYNSVIIEPLLIKEATQKGYAEAYDGDSVTLDQPNSETRRGRVGNQMANTLTTSCNVGIVQLGNIVSTGNWDNPERGRIYSAEGISPALSTMQGGGLEPKIVEMFNPYNNSKITDVAPTQTSQCDHITTSSSVLIKYNNYRIRKLTPRECWRLMGVRDEQYDKLHGLSNTQLYKLAGNSIVVDVLMGIFKNMFMENDTKGQLTLL